MDVRGYHLVDEGGRPFFWLADTAWNLWCKGAPEDWDAYLATRRRQGFNVIQFVAGWWRGCMQPRHGRPFDLQNGRLVWDESAWASLDDLFARIEAHGMVAAPINLWTLTDIDPGQVLSVEQCVEVVSRQTTRWTSPNIVWMLGGDGNYAAPEVADRWRTVGRAGLVANPGQLATLHPCGTSWTAESFVGEPWYRIVGIQSGHGAKNHDLEFLVKGDYARAWRDVQMPFLNLEPNYEDARSYGDRVHLTDYHVRRASYWSLLVAPPAGVTYGIGSIWMWAEREGEIAENHDSSWVGRPWKEELDTGAARSMTVLKSIFERLPWTDLRPAPELLGHQPGDRNVRRWQAVAANADRTSVVVYCPSGGPVELAQLPGDGWMQIDPKTGQETPARLQGNRLLSTRATLGGDVLFVRG